MNTLTALAAHRDDFRLGSPEPTGPALDHLCPVCDGEGDAHPHCYCNGLGVITAAQGMHHGAKGYVPRQRDARGAPIGHPICAGWLAQHRKASR